MPSNTTFSIMSGINNLQTFLMFVTERLTPYNHEVAIRGDILGMNDPYIKLARFAIEEFVKTGKIIEVPKNMPKEMLEKRAGVFVSIHKKHDLRGCIGTFQPTKGNIVREIIDNTISACSQDPRFPRVTNDELSDLQISVDILEKPEPVINIDRQLAMEQLDPKKYGVIVKSTSDSRTGLLLPDLEGVDSPEYQIAIAREKAGILPNEEIHLYRFEVTRHK